MDGREDETGTSRLSVAQSHSAFRTRRFALPLWNLFPFPHHMRLILNM